MGWKGGGASLLPPCSLPHCTAAVSAGMAPLTICSLIANIRVHFLRHWTGTERWRAVLWAFLSLSPTLPFSLYHCSLWCWCKDAHKHTCRQQLSHLANLLSYSVQLHILLIEHAGTVTLWCKDAINVSIGWCSLKCIFLSGVCLLWLLERLSKSLENVIPKLQIHLAKPMNYNH